MKHSIFLLFTAALFIQASCSHKPPTPIEEKVPDISGDRWYMHIDPIKYNTTNGSGTYSWQEFDLTFKKEFDTQYKYTISGSTTHQEMTGHAVYNKITKQFTCDTLFGNEDEIGYFVGKYNSEKVEISGTIYIDVYIHTSVITGFYVHLEGPFLMTK